jgi:hypothetical protein
LPYFSTVYALELNDGASKVLKNNSANESRVKALKETVGDNSIPAQSLNLAILLGVLDHIPDTGLAIKDVASKIKSCGVFLCYLYYKLGDKPLFYPGLFWVLSSIHLVICGLPHKMHRLIVRVILGEVYLPLGSTSKLLGNSSKMPRFFLCITQRCNL